MWKKIKRAKGAGRDRRNTFGVRRTKTGNKSSFFLMPQGTTNKPAVNIYSDGKGNIAFEFADKGEFKVGKAGAVQQISIPREFASLIPYGTRDCAVMWDDSLLILNVNQFQPKAVAAE